MLSNALVIDDDLDVQLLGKMLLTQQGYDVVTAGSLGELARKPALLNAELILLDLGLGEFRVIVKSGGWRSGGSPV